MDKKEISNNKFYNYFNDRIRKAESEIHLTGEGFDRKKSRTFSRENTDALIEALKKDVSVIRLQTTVEVFDYYEEHLLELLAYPNFHLYLDQGFWNRGGICSIDSSDAIDNVSEYLLSVPKMEGATTSNIASLAAFVIGNQELSLNVKGMIMDHVKDENKVIRITKENFKKHFNQTLTT